MRQQTSPAKFIGFARGRRADLLGGSARAAAQPMPDAENGRYALSPVADGVIRLDTRTGAVSTCSNSGAGWACYAVPDERAALDAEIGRLQADNEKLKARTGGARDRPFRARSTSRCRRRIAESRRSRRWPRASARSKFPGSKFHCRATATWTA